MNNQLPPSAVAVLGKDVHSGRDGNPSVPRELFAVAHSVAHTSVLMIEYTLLKSGEVGCAMAATQPE